MSYRVLVLPDQDHMPLAVLERLEQLVSRGATVIGPRPSRVPGLADHEERTTKLRAIADRMWGPGHGTTGKHRRHGMGTVVSGWDAGPWLARASVPPDFSCLDEDHAPHLDFIHRQTTDTDIYFVRNKSRSRLRADCVFRVTGRAPQLWDPSDGSMRPQIQHRPVRGGTRLPLDLAPGGSVFVVFHATPSPQRFDSLSLTTGPLDPNLPAPRLVPSGGVRPKVECWQNGSYRLRDADGRKFAIELDRLPAPRTVGGEWALAFDAGRGAPGNIRLPKLISWTDHPDPGVRYFSGTGRYTRVVEVPADWLASGVRVHLDLGEVREVAEVFVNGRSAGVLWKPPYRAEITPLVKPGRNELAIEVMNLWINRLTGDSKLPVEQRVTRTNITSDGGGYRRRSEPWRVEPAGLLGPVRLLPSVEVDVDP